MIVKSEPWAQPPVQQPKPRTSPKPKPTSVINDDSITALVKAHEQQEPSSIAECVTACWHEKVNTVIDMDMGKLLEYCQVLCHPKFKDDWNILAANEFGRLAQGVGEQVKGTNMIYFINKAEILADRWQDVTYIKFVCTVRTEKKDPNKSRATMGGNLINYPDDVNTLTANLLLIKIFLNSMISTPGMRFASAKISDSYLMTPLK